MVVGEGVRGGWRGVFCEVGVVIGWVVRVGGESVCGEGVVIWGGNRVLGWVVGWDGGVK